MLLVMLSLRIRVNTIAEFDWSNLLHTLCSCFCLQIIFYYHMYGAHIGSLIIYQRTTLKHEKILLNLTGNQGNFWQRKALTVSGDGDEDFQVVFEGIAGEGPKDGIALDDLTFSRDCLASQEFLPAEPTKLPPIGMFLLWTVYVSLERRNNSIIFISLSLFQKRNIIHILLKTGRNSITFRLPMKF